MKAETPGERMAEVRLSMGWSQTDLAREAGISRTTVSRLERNMLSPDHPAMQQCMDAMKMSPEAVGIIMDPEKAMAEPGWKDPNDPEEIERLQKELDVLMLQYPLLDHYARSIMMSVLWLEMNRMKGKEHDMTSLMAPLVQEGSGRILKKIEEPDPTWMDAVRIANQATKPVASNGGPEAPANQTDAGPELPKAPAARTEAPAERPKAPAASTETAHE